MWRPMSFIILSVGLVQAMQLVAVQTIFRHGDRAPSNPYPKDPISIDNWPNGWSQLTELGAFQTQELGAYYRRQYAHRLKLFKQPSSQKELLVRSTSKQRAIESAQNMLVGLFDRRHNLPEIHVTGEYKTDLLLKPNSVTCKKYDDIVATDNELLFTKYDTMYSSLFSQLSDLTGYNVSMQNIDLVYDAVFREVVHGLSQDEWLFYYTANKETGKLITFFDMILELKRIQRLNEFNSFEKSRLRTGYLLGHIVRQLEEVANSNNLPKLTLYSSHDATLTSLLYSLNASNELMVPYAAAISFELYADGFHLPTYYVKALYRNKTGDDEALELGINGCNGCMWELKQFKSALESATFGTVEEQERECEA